MKVDKILSIISHLLFILSAMFIVFWILDKYNPLMGFISGNISMALLLVFAVLAFVNSILTIIYLLQKLFTKIKVVLSKKILGFRPVLFRTRETIENPFTKVGGFCLYSF